MIKRMYQLNNSDLLGSPDSLMPASTPSIISPAQSYRWNDPDVFRSIVSKVIMTDEETDPIQNSALNLIVFRKGC